MKISLGRLISGYQPSLKFPLDPKSQSLYHPSIHTPRVALGSGHKNQSDHPASRKDNMQLPTTAPVLKLVQSYRRPSPLRPPAAASSSMPSSLLSDSNSPMAEDFDTGNHSHHSDDSLKHMHKFTKDKSKLTKDKHAMTPRPCDVHAEVHQQVLHTLQTLPNLEEEFPFTAVSHILAQVRPLLTPTAACIVCELANASNWLLVGLLARDYDRSDIVYRVFEAMVWEDIDVEQVLPHVLAARKKGAATGQAAAPDEPDGGDLQKEKKKGWRRRIIDAGKMVLAKLKGRKRKPKVVGDNPGAAGGNSLAVGDHVHDFGEDLHVTVSDGQTTGEDEGAVEAVLML